MPILRKRYFDCPVTIDGETVRLKLKRLTVPEFEEFSAMFNAMSKGQVMKPLPECATTAELRAHIRQDQLRDLLDNAAWVQAVFEQYVSVTEGDVFDVDEQGQAVPVTSGLQFMQLFAGHTALLSGVLADLWLANVLTEEQKKKLQSPSASGTGSTIASSPAEAGPRPETTVISAAPADSARAVAATALSSAASCGMTALSS